MGMTTPRTGAIAQDALARMLAASPDLSSPVTARAACDPAFMEGALMSGLRRLCNDDGVERDRNLRLWVSQSSDDAFEQLLFAAPPQDGEGFAPWAARLFGDRNWGMVINHAERWMVEIVDAILPALAPLTHEIPVPSTRFELVGFLGNYAQTPFGLHRDPANLRSVHFHAGPGTKVFHVDAADGAQQARFVSEDQIAASCERFEIAPGDAFSIPAHKPHVGSCEGINASVALVIRREFKKTLLSQALSDAFRRLEDAVPLPHDVSDLRVDEGSWFAPEDFGPPDVSMRDWSERAVTEFMHRQLSNAGFTAPPIETAAPAAPPRRIRLAKGHPISAVRADGVIVLHARGNRMDLPDAPELWAFLAALTDCGEADVSAAPAPDHGGPGLVRELADVLLRSRAATVLA